MALGESKTNKKGDPFSIRLQGQHDRKIVFIQQELNISKSEVIDFLIDSSLAELQTQFDFSSL